jgi:hypothetical protein
MSSADLDLQCRDVAELVTEFLLGVLPAEQSATIEGHLCFCQGCEIYVKQMRATVSLTASLRRSTAEGATLDELVALYARWKSARGLP